MAPFNIDRFHICVMLYWQLSKFIMAQMLFPMFSNYVPKWRCSADQEFSKNCSLMAACSGGVEYENSYFQSAGKFHELEFLVSYFSFKHWNSIGSVAHRCTGQRFTHNYSLLASLLER
jgi:hypothetical protein